MTLDIVDSIKKATCCEDIFRACETLDTLTLTASVTRKISRALKKHCFGNNKGSEQIVRIAYLGNITFEPLPEYISAVSSCYGLLSDAYIGGYDQTIQELIDPNSRLNTFDADVIFLHFSVREIAAEVTQQYSSLGEHALSSAHNKIIDTVVHSVEQALSRHSASVLLSNFPAPMYHHFGVADQKQVMSEQTFYANLNLALAKRFKDEMRVQILDVERLTSQYGKQNAFDEKLYYLAKIPWQESFYPFLADEIVRHIDVIKGRGRKCLVVDLDNTLWGGVLGEAGVHGVKVGHGDGESEAFYAFQYKIRALKERGILLAICSKNNPEDVEELFSARTDMPLKLSDFSALEISWDRKHEGLKRIAQKLNIGLDSLAFIDDNPAECELIRQMLPEVMTVLLPPDPSVYSTLIDRLHGFDKLAISEEDSVKAVQYQNNAERSAHQSHFEDLESYLNSLQTTITIAAAGEQDQLRVHQLFSKTNQFNLTTKRYTLSDVKAMMECLEDDLYVVKAADKFGDLGTIGLFLIKNAKAGEPFIDSFILSCRAMGRGIETAVMNYIKKNYIKHMSDNGLKALYIPTQKNKPVSSFYKDEGFTVVDGENESESYMLSADNVAEKSCSWINVN